MNVLTACDSGFFHCLKELAENVKEVYGKKLIVYDIGLTDEDKAAVDAEYIKLDIDPKLNHKGQSVLAPSGHPSTRATHKPFCVRHYFEHHDEPMIFIDTDCLFNERVEETGFDVGVTYTPVRKGKEIIYYNGIINSGVIFFNTPAKELVDRWAGNCYQEPTTDQKALSDVLEETIDFTKYNTIQQWGDLKIKIFDTNEYNDFHLTSKSKINHFINTKHQKDIYAQLIEGRRQGKDIRKMFREIKRGKKSFMSKIASLVGLDK